MAIREQYKTYDIQTCVYELLSSYTDAPWDDWSVVYGWPDLTSAGDSTTDVSGDFDPTIYVMEPRKTAEAQMMGGGKPLNQWEMTVGFWLQRKDGGPDEMSVWVSEMLYKFEDITTIHQATFNVSLGSTDFTGTTLKAQGLYVLGITGPSADMGEDKDEFRKEITLILKG